MVPASKVTLMWGVASRFAVSCVFWSGARYSMWLFGTARKLAPEQREVQEGEKKEELTRDLKMWAGSMAIELVTSTTMLTPYLICKHVHRLYFSALFPSLGALASIFDRFDHLSYMVFVVHALDPSFNSAPNNVDRVTLLWHAPATVATLAKLGLRIYRQGLSKTRLWRVLCVLGLQYVFRAVMGSFAIFPIGSDLEALSCVALMTYDKWSDAYLMRHTWPFW